MKTSSELLEWLNEKVENHQWASVHQERTVEHRWVRHTGGRVIRAGISAAIAPSQSFQFVIDSEAVEPEYVAAAKNAVLSVLLSQSWEPVLRCTVRLFGFQQHEQESSYAAFYAVTKEAIERLLGVVPGHTHNIVWGGENGA